MATSSSGKVIMMDPVGEVRIQRAGLTPRLSEMRGNVIGYLFNGHPQWETLWDMAQDQLIERYNFADQMLIVKPNLCAPAQLKHIEEMTLRVDAAIVGVGA